MFEKIVCVESQSFLLYICICLILRILFLVVIVLYRIVTITNLDVLILKKHMDSQGKFIFNYTELLNNRYVLAANGNCTILNNKYKSGYGRISVTFLSYIKKYMHIHIYMHIDI